MTCLLPQFKCLPEPDTFSFYSKTHLQSSAKISRIKESIYVRTHCVLSTASPPASTATTTVLELEKMRLMSFEARSDPPATNKPWSYIGTMGLQTEQEKEAFPTSEEAIIAATAAQAVALAKEAVKVAKDAATLVGPNYSKKLNDEVATITREADSILFEELQLAEAGLLSELEEDYLTKENGSGDPEPTCEELEHLEALFSSNIAVRSRRQTERKAKRTKAAEKAASNVVSVKSGSTSRKKRGSAQEIDHSDPLRFFRGTTNTSKLLTASEESLLSAGIQDLIKLEKLHDELVERYGGQLTFAQWAAAASVDQKTLRMRLDHGKRCKDKMITSNVRLVISIAKNYQGVGMNLQDLVQEGCRGLIRGAEKFDASKGFKFSTYAHWWIKQAVRKSLSDQSRTIRLPFHMVEATYRVKEARKQLFSENGKQPSNEEVAEATGLSMKRLETVLSTPKAPRSLDQKFGIDNSMKPSDVIADPEAETSEELLIKQLMKKDLDKVLDTLNPREKQVVRWRFGLEDGRMKTLQEIGEIMGVSRERIRQIEASAFRKLKNKRRTKHLQQYVTA